MPRRRTPFRLPSPRSAALIGAVAAVSWALAAPRPAEAGCSTDASDLSVSGARVLSWVNRPGNKAEATVAITITNAGEGAFTDVATTLTSVSGFAMASITDAASACEDVGALSSVECADRVKVQVRRADKAAFETAVAGWPDAPYEATLAFDPVAATESYAYQPTVLALDAADLALVLDYGEDAGGTYIRFRGHSAEIDAIASGSVLVSPPADFCTNLYEEGETTPFALLAGTVTRGPAGPNQITKAYYTFAGLGDVYESARFLLTLEAQALDSMPVPDGVFTIESPDTAFNDLPLAGGVVEVDGSVAVASAVYDLDALLRNGDMDSSTEIVTVDQSATLSVTASADAVLTDPATVVGGIEIDYGTVYFGAVGIPLQLAFDVTADLTGSVTASTSTSSVHDGIVETTIDWTRAGGAVATVVLTDVPYSYSPPSVTDAGVDGDLVATLSTLVSAVADGTAGSSVDIATWLETAVVTGGDPWWTYAAGWTVTATEGLVLGGLAADAGAAGTYEEEVWTAAEAAAAMGMAMRAADRAIVAQAGQEIRWSRTFDFAGGADDYGYAADLVAGGDVVLSSGREGRFSVARLDPLGDVLWGRRASASGWQPVRLVTLSDGSVLVGGHNSLSGGRLFLVRLGGDGSLISARTYDLGATATLEAMALYGAPPGPDAGVLLVGRVAQGVGAGFALRVDSSGTVLWARRYELGEATEVRDVALTPSGALLVGRTDADIAGVDTGPNGLVCAIDGGGAPQWARIVGSSFDDSLNAVISLESGEVLATGQMGTDGVATPGGLWLLRLQSDGAVVGHATLGELDAGPNNGLTPDDTGLELRKSASGLSLLATTGAGNDLGAWLVQLGGDGAPHRLVTFDGLAGDRLDSVIDTGTGMLLAGRSSSYAAGGPGAEIDTWIVRTAYSGVLDFAPALASRNELAVFQVVPPPEFHLGEPHHGDVAVTLGAPTFPVSVLTPSVSLSSIEPDVMVQTP